MFNFLKWFFVIDFLGWVVFPLAYSIFPNLKDKGFSISKIFGLLLWGYLYWLLNTFKLLNNSQISVIFVFLIIILGSICFIRKNLKGIIDYIKTNKKLILFYEIVFLVVFSAWALIRAANPEIIGTEKPMELAFINGIYRSPKFPPNDPWLSGYSISYYYFGYLLVAMLMHLCGTASGVAFNLAVALWFALVFVASSGILFNLLISQDKSPTISKREIIRLLLLSLLAPVMILILSNSEGFLEVFHSRGFFWDFQPDGQAVSKLWQWMDIKELTKAPSLPLDWRPSRSGGIWWWRASRVLQDYDVAGNPHEIIDEFPFFAFLLADFHPHLISMPFVLLVIYFGFSRFVSNLVMEVNKINLLNSDIVVGGFLVGSLIFINTWDFPVYAGLLISLYGVSLYLKKRGRGFPIKQIIIYGLSLGIISILFYLPFFLGLSSQAGGFLPSLVFRTRGIHFLVMFFPQIFLISLFLISISKTYRIKQLFWKVIVFILGIGLILLVLSLGYVVALDNLSEVLSFLGKLFRTDTTEIVLQTENNFQGFLSIFGSQSAGELIISTITSIAKDPTVIVILIIWVASCVSLITDVKLKSRSVEKLENIHTNDSLVLILIIFGAMLCLVPEFFYLRDQFGWRMNTIFKFYFQAWILLSFSGAYFVTSFLLIKSQRIRKLALIGLTALIIGICLIYPAFAIIDKTNGFKNINISLDGNKYLQIGNQFENEALSFLMDVPYGVVAEAIGGSYSGYGRVSKLTGLPTVLGWPGHELQWRGGTEEIGTRESDIKLLYSANDWESAKQILDRYGIRYVYIGKPEQSSYAVSEEKFRNNLAAIFINPETTIYSYEK